MDSAELKASYGDHLVFWGRGGYAEGDAVWHPDGGPEQVFQRYEIFFPGGGFVFNGTNNIQAATPIENIVAMLNAVHEFNGRY